MRWIVPLCVALITTAGFAQEIKVGPWTFVPASDGFGRLAYDGQVVVNGVRISGFKPGWKGSRFHFGGMAPKVRADQRKITWTKIIPEQASLTLDLTLSETSATWTLEGTVEPGGPCEFGLRLPTDAYRHATDAILARVGSASHDFDTRPFKPIGVSGNIVLERASRSFTWECASSPGRFMLQDKRAWTPSTLRLITVAGTSAKPVRLKASARLSVTDYDVAESARRQATLFQKTRWFDAVSVSNSGFENQGAGWSIPANGAVCEDNPRTGKQCARLVVTDPAKESVYITRQIPVVGGSAYALDCYVRTKGVTKAPGKMPSVGAGLIVEWADKDGKWFASGQYACKLFGDHDWTHRKCAELRAPDNAGYAAVFLALRGAGTAWFDDLSLVRVFKTFALESPTPGIRLYDNTPAFSWRGDAKALEYTLELSQDKSFPTATTKTWTTKKARCALRSPIPPGTWFWRVAAPGYEPTVVWQFEQTAPLDADTTAPAIEGDAARVTAADGVVSITVTDECAMLPKIRATLAKTELVCTATAAGGGRFQVALTCPGGWRRGLNTVKLVASDTAGNRTERNLWIVCQPVPDNAVRIEQDGAYSSGGKRIFPFGIYQVSPKAMPTVKAGGFDVVHAYTWESSQDDRAAGKYLDAAWRNGLRVFIGFDRGNSSGNGIVQGNVQHIVNRVAALSDHPGLFCWYLFDEPELAHQYLSPTALIRYAELIRTLDPHHPVVVTTWGNGMNRYRRSWDT
ncbi:MAG: hypothetical protein KAI66_20585, partial [Lentisphaeria bacterium]|nr:hypothetical protein [Lentisphaeria bacterium]